MALKTITPDGQAIITVPATESIAISNYGGGIASIYYLITDSNRPPAYQLQQTLENSGVVLGAFAAGKTVKIEAGGSTVVYDVGASPDTGIGDADTLGGQLPSYYATDSAVVHNTGAESIGGGKTFTSTLTIGNAGPRIKLDETDSTTQTELLLSGGNCYLQVSSTGYTGGGSLYIAGKDNADLALFRVKYAGAFNNIWHAGNDGSGSGLDADTLDGNQGSYYQPLYPAQGAQTAQTTDDTLTAAELDARIITVNQGAAGTSSQTLPLATAMDSYFTGVSSNFGFEFSVINISTNAAEDATIVTNTGWTLVGSMVIESFDNDRARSSGRFFARKTGTGAWTLYRIA